VKVYVSVNGIVKASEYLSNFSYNDVFGYVTQLLPNAPDIVISGIKFYPTGNRGVNGSGNTVFVDQVAGTAGGSMNGPAFNTVQGAIGYITTNNLHGVNIFVYPGTYELPDEVTLPDDCSLTGASVQTTIIQRTNVAVSGYLITMGTNTRVESVTLKISSSAASGSISLTGLVFPDATSVNAKLRTAVLTVDNSSLGYDVSSDAIGVLSSGTGTLGTASFSFNSIKGCTINVKSNGSGIKRGILVNGGNVMSTRDTNIYVAAPVDGASQGSYVGVETNSSGASIQLRSTTIGTVAPTAGQQYTASDILQTSPSTVSDPTYLASEGIQIGPGTDLVTKTAGGRGFSTFVYPSTIYYGLKGNISTGTPGFLWPGTQAVTSGVFPDPSGKVDNVVVNVTNLGAGNNITVSSITGIAVGMPIVFSRTGGNIVENVVYYVHSYTSVTTLKISETQYGGVYTTTNLGTVAWTAAVYANINTFATSIDATNALYVSSTTNLTVGMPVTLSSSLGNIVAGEPYFISLIGSGYIKVIDSFGNNPATSPYTPSYPIGLTGHTTTTRVTATEAGGNAGRITVGSSAGLSAGMPIVFASSFNNVIGRTQYYIHSIDSATKIFITWEWGGVISPTPAGSGLTVNAYIFPISSAPAFYRVQQPSILSGISCALAIPASPSGGADTLTVSVYITPKNANPQTGISAIPYYSKTLTSASGNSLSYYGTSYNLAAGDRISVFVSFTPGTTAHDLSVQLDMF